jgi:hypothetical protein
MGKELKSKTFSINPIVGTVLVAIIGLFGTGIGASIGGYYNIKLEKEKLRSSLILKAVETTDPESALNYLKLLRDTGLVTDIDVTIEEWTNDTTLIPLRPTSNQIALDGMANMDRKTRISSTEELINEESGNPDIIRDVLQSLRVPKSPDGLWNNIVYLNATKKFAYNNELVKFAMDEIAAFESDVKQGKLLLGPATKKSLENYKKYLRDIQRQL